MGIDILLKKSASELGVFSKMNPYSTKMSLDLAQGCGSIDFYPLFEGVTLAYIRIFSKTWPAPDMSLVKDIIYLNYCFGGRCEVRLDNGIFTYVSENEFCISKSSASKQYSYPRKYYEGLELFLDKETLQNTSHILLKDFQIDIKKLISSYCYSDKPFTSIININAENIFKELWKLRNSPQMFKMKLEVLQLLYLLTEQPISYKNKSQLFLTTSQVEIAKTVEQIITNDLQKKYTISELSLKFNISETSLKNYFKGVFGQNISTYLREIRMNEAAMQLEENKKKVSDIAGEVGYENQSKFANIFKKFYKLSPLEYRRQKSLTTIQEKGKYT